MKTELKSAGTVKIDLFENGVLLVSRKINNLVVTGGKAFITSQILTGAGTPMSHMALGESATAPATGQTALLDEIARVALDTAAQATDTTANDSVEFTATFGPGVGTGDLREIALLNAGVAGTMLSRATFDLITKTSTMTAVVTWRIALL